MQSPNENHVNFSSMGPAMSESQVSDSQNPSSTSHHSQQGAYNSNLNILESEHLQRQDDDEEEEMPSMSVQMTIILLVTVTVVS